MKTRCKMQNKVKLPKGFKLVDDIYPKKVIEALENDTGVRDPMTITGGHESETLEESIARIRREIGRASCRERVY